MTPKEIILAILDHSTKFSIESQELLKRVDKRGEFHGSAKDINHKRFLKFCRTALEEEYLPTPLREKIEAIMPNWGGYRENAGRPSTGRKKRQLYISDEEYESIKRYIEDMRKSP